MLAMLREQSRWLSGHAANVTSQFGEDGIISRALSLLPDRTNWCVEFGAWDGKLYSNTYDLVTTHNYRGVFIEPDSAKFRELQRTHSSDRHTLINAFVGFTGSDSLDVLLSRTEIPAEFDLLSIDIDGNDYHAWESVHKYRPRLVIIEFNPTISNATLFVQKKESGRQQGASPAALVELGRSKGYELIAATTVNLLFVASEYYSLFGITDNSLELMRDDSKIPRIFVGYDGHVFLSQGSSFGAIDIQWHGVALKEPDVQVIPARLQKYPDDYTRLERRLFSLRFHPRRLLRRLMRW